MKNLLFELCSFSYIYHRNMLSTIKYFYYYYHFIVITISYLCITQIQPSHDHIQLNKLLSCLPNLLVADTTLYNSIQSQASVEISGEAVALSSMSCLASFIIRHSDSVGKQQAEAANSVQQASLPRRLHLHGCNVMQSRRHRVHIQNMLIIECPCL